MSTPPRGPPAGLFGLDAVWEGLATRTPADEGPAGRSEGFGHRDLLLVVAAGEHAGRRAMEPIDADFELLGAGVVDRGLGEGAMDGC